MIAFVTSLRHPDNATDYAYTEQLLQETLRSIDNQTDDSYVVFVVGNRPPSFELPRQVHFVAVDFPAPRRVTGPHADRDGFVRDKGTKIAVGLLAAREYNPEWVMIFDADDFIHRRLVEFANAASGSAGWVIDTGLVYSRSRNGYRRQPRFHRTCGTSFVIPYSAYGVPAALGVDASQDQLLDAYGEVLPQIIGAHRNAVQWHQARGRDLESLPFAGAVYHVDTGENHSGKALAGLIRPWSKKLNRDYAIGSAAPRLVTLWSAWGPRAVAESTADFVDRLKKAIAKRVLRSGSAARQ